MVVIVLNGGHNDINEVMVVLMVVMVYEVVIVIYVVDDSGINECVCTTVVIKFW